MMMGLGLNRWTSSCQWDSIKKILGIMGEMFQESQPFPISCSWTLENNLAAVFPVLWWMDFDSPLVFLYSSFFIHTLTFSLVLQTPYSPELWDQPGWRRLSSSIFSWCRAEDLAHVIFKHLNDMKKMLQSVTWHIEKGLVTWERPRTEWNRGNLGKHTIWISYCLQDTCSY